jgi:hypothetical protein
MVLSTVISLQFKLTFVMYRTAQNIFNYFEDYARFFGAPTKMFDKKPYHIFN